MKHLFLIISLFASFVQAQSLTLEQAQALARENYPLVQRVGLIEKARQYNIENAAKGWLPRIDINARASYQNEVTEIPLAMPGLDIEPLSKDQYRVVADISQPIYDGGVIGHQKKLAEISGDVALQQNEVQLNMLEERVNNIFFGILQIDEQLQTIALSENDIDNAIEKAEAQLEFGVILRSQLNILKAQKIDLNQNKTELAATRKNFADMLGLFTGIPVTEETSLVRPEKAMLNTENQRAELRLFDLQHQQLETQKSLVKAANLPKLGAFFQGGYGKPGFNMLENGFDVFYMGGLTLNIPITGFYTQKNDLALIENQQQEIGVQRENFLFNQEFTSLQNNNELDKIQQLINQDNELIEIREDIMESTRAQLENGVITTSDFLRELNELERARTQKILHETQYLLTQYNQKANLNN